MRFKRTNINDLCDLASFHLGEHENKDDWISLIVFLAHRGAEQNVSHGVLLIGQALPRWNEHIRITDANSHIIEGRVTRAIGRVE